MANDEAGNTRVIYLITTSTPSQGLTPETKRREVVSMDPTKAAPVARKDLPIDPEDEHVAMNYGILPVADGFAYTKNIFKPGGYVAFFNADSLVSKTHATDVDAVIDDGYTTVSFQSCKCIAPLNQGDSRDLHFFDQTGTEIGVFRNLGGFRAARHGFLVQHDTGQKTDALNITPGDRASGVFYFDMHTKALAGPIAPYLDNEGMFPDRTGPYSASPLTESDGEYYGDNLLLYSGLRGSDTGYLTVFNMATKKVAFSIGGPQLKGLNINYVRVAGNYIYLDNDSDHPVIDMRTQKSVHSGWARTPLNELGEGWALIGEGDKNTGTCSSADANACPQSRSGAQQYLARGATGPFDGPWF